MLPGSADWTPAPVCKQGGGNLTENNHCSHLIQLQKYPAKHFQMNSSCCDSACWPNEVKRSGGRFKALAGVSYELWLWAATLLHPQPQWYAVKNICLLSRSVTHRWIQLNHPGYSNPATKKMKIKERIQWSQQGREGQIRYDDIHVMSCIQLTVNLSGTAQIQF